MLKAFQNDEDLSRYIPMRCYHYSRRPARNRMQYRSNNANVDAPGRPSNGLDPSWSSRQRKKNQKNGTGASDD